MKKYFALSCISALAIMQVNAEENYSLDKVVVSASGFVQEIKEAPATINVISKKELESKPYKDVAQAISDIPGVDLFASKGKTGAYNVTMRGITGYTLILVDGRRQGVGGEIGPNGFGETLNTFLPPLDSVERIEVIKGPMSTLYGSEALGGVINIITKKVSDKWGYSISTNSILNANSEWGNSYGYSLFTSGPLVKDKLGLNFRFAQDYRSQSNVESLSSSGQVVPATQAQSPTKANSYNIGTRLNYLIDSSNTLTFDIDYANSHYDNKKGQIGTLTAPLANGGLTGGYTDNMNIEKLVSFLSHEGVYDSFSINSAVQYNRVSNDGRMVVGQSTQPYLGENRDILAQDIIADTKAVIPLGDKNILSVGGEYKLEKMEDKIANPTSFDQYLLAVFAEDEYSVLENLRVTLGARYNYHEIFGDNISPRGYLVYNATDNLTLKGGVSTGFKAPYANRLIAGSYSYSGQGRIPVYGNPNLKEETSLNYEVGAVYNNDLFFASVTGFMTEFDDKISSQSYAQGALIPGIGACDGSSCSQAINHGKVDYKGVEVGAGITPVQNFNINLAYTYLETEVKESSDLSAIGKPEVDSLKHNIVTKMEYNFGKVTPWIKGEWQIDRYMGDININREYYKDIFLASIGLSYAINENWNLNAGIYNLLDKDFSSSYETYTSGGAVNYVNAYNRIEEGRRLYLSITGRF